MQFLSYTEYILKFEFSFLSKDCQIAKLPDCPLQLKFLLRTNFKLSKKNVFCVQRMNVLKKDFLFVTIF